MWLFSARYRYGTTSSSTCGLHACRGKATGNRRQKIWPPVDEDFAKIPIQIPFTKDSCWLERKMDQDVKKSMCDIGEIWFLCRSVSLQSSIKDAHTKGGRVRQNAVKSRQGGDRVSTYADVHNVLSADFKKLADCIDELCLQSDAGWLQLVLVDVATELSDYSNIVVCIACGSLTVGPTVYSEVSGDPYVTPSPSLTCPPECSCQSPWCWDVSRIRFHRLVRHLACQQLSTAQLTYTGYRVLLDGSPKCMQQILNTAYLRAVFSQ